MALTADNELWVWSQKSKPKCIAQNCSQFAVSESHAIFTSKSSLIKLDPKEKKETLLKERPLTHLSVGDDFCIALGKTIKAPSLAQKRILKRPKKPADLLRAQSQLIDSYQLNKSLHVQSLQAQNQALEL